MNHQTHTSLCSARRKSLLEKTLLAALLSAGSAPALADSSNTGTAAPVITLPGILVTAPAMTDALTVETDPRSPRQPLPAHDGADYLKTIPGFAVTRKGGTDGDPVFRGMAGSRLGILVDGENILGGCNFRMDAPTAYIYPELYDNLTVIKGAQSVQHGPGNSAATILFARKSPRFAAPGYRVYGSVLAGSFGRHDELVDARIGNRSGYLQLTGTHSASDDYEDGDGNAVHSQYQRYSVNGALGWTPDETTRAEISLAQSDGEAAYADRGMDGTKFLRNSSNLRIEKTNLSPLLGKLEAHVYSNDVDHIMDDQTLRTPGMMGYANLVRETRGGKIATALNVGDNTVVDLGIDAQENDHSSRSAPASGVYTAWTNDATFAQQGVFAEVDHAIGEQDRLVAGLRMDQWEATDQRAMIMIMGMGGGMVANPTANQTRDEDLASGFLRVEHTLAATPTTLFAGVSQTERFPDYWELISKRGAASNSAFNTAQAEQTQQIDAGALYKGDNTHYSVSFFYNTINDYLLVDYTLMGGDRMMIGVTRNVDASSYGGELGSSHTIAQHWKVDATVAWVRGSNDTDNKPLAQLAPLEARLGLTWAAANWSVGGLLRAVDNQDRFALGQGNIVGKDLGATPGFAVFSLNGNWKPAKNALLSAGVDNLFDRRYAEFVSRAGGNGMGGAIPGYVQTTRVNEAGRTFWLKASVDF